MRPGPLTIARRVDHPYAQTVRTHADPRRSTLASVAWFALITLIIIQGYLLLHELGHALAAVSVGATVTGVDARMWSDRPHASYDFGSVGSGARAFVTAAGTLLPVAVWALALPLVPRRLPPHWEVVRLAASAGALAGFLVWLVLPWPAMHARAATDDAVRFTQQSGWPPALVVALAAALLLAGTAWAWRSMGGAETFRALRTVRRELLRVRPKSVLTAATALVGMMLLAAGLHAWLGGSAAATPSGVPEAPSHAALLDLQLEGGRFDETYPGGVADGGLVLLALRFEDVAGGPFAIRLVDAAGEEHTVAGFGPETRMGVAASHPRVTPAAGPWSVRVEAEATVGRLRVWEVTHEAP